MKFGQVIRNDGPESHLSKRGTPTMGGLMIIAAIFISVLLWSRLDNPYVWLVLFVLGAYGAIGFADDYLKVVRKNTDGLIARWKYFGQSAVALLVAVFLYTTATHDGQTQLFATGVYRDVFELDGSRLRLQRRVVICDSSRIDTLRAQNAQHQPAPTQAARSQGGVVVGCQIEVYRYRNVKPVQAVLTDFWGQQSGCARTVGWKAHRRQP